MLGHWAILANTLLHCTCKSSPYIILQKSNLLSVPAFHSQQCCQYNTLSQYLNQCTISKVFRVIRATEICCQPSDSIHINTFLTPSKIHNIETTGVLINSAPPRVPNHLSFLPSYSYLQSFILHWENYFPSALAPAPLCVVTIIIAWTAGGEPELPAAVWSWHQVCSGALALLEVLQGHGIKCDIKDQDADQFKLLSKKRP